LRGVRRPRYSETVMTLSRPHVEQRTVMVSKSGPMSVAFRPSDRQCGQRTTRSAPGSGFDTTRRAPGTGFGIDSFRSSEFLASRRRSVSRRR
jgi:hypothetical protein